MSLGGAPGRRGRSARHLQPRFRSAPTSASWSTGARRRARRRCTARRPGDGGRRLLARAIAAAARPRCCGATLPDLPGPDDDDELRARGGAARHRIGSRCALGIPVLAVVGHRGLGLTGAAPLLAHPEKLESAPRDSPPSPTVALAAAWADSISRACTDAATRQPAAAPRPSTASCCTRWRAPPAVRGVMVTFFQLIFAWAAPAMDWIDGVDGDGRRAACAQPAPAGTAHRLRGRRTHRGRWSRS